METGKLKVNAFIEQGKDGTYGVYIDLDENRLNYGVIGEGKTVEEAKSDFLGCYEDVRNHFYTEGELFQECDFDFKYDIASFLSYYSNILTLPGLGKITGINQRQLEFYVEGRTRPRPETVKKIEHSLHALSTELGHVRFCG
jgi:hypothetical protein